MTLIGISSSPVQGGNVDRMVQFVLNRTGKDTQFVNLAQLSFSPCQACAHLCAGDNLCKLDDDLQPLYAELVQAEALVLGTPSYFNSSILPCFTCGYGTVCAIGASQKVYGEKGRKQLKVTEHSFKRWEDDPEVFEHLEMIAGKLKDLNV